MRRARGVVMLAGLFAGLPTGCSLVVDTNGLSGASRSDASPDAAHAHDAGGLWDGGPFFPESDSGCAPYGSTCGAGTACCAGNCVHFGPAGIGANACL